MPRIEAIATALPEHAIRQDEVHALLNEILPEDGKAAALQILANSQVATRTLAMPIAWYLEQHGFAARNDAYLNVGLRLAHQAARRAIAAAGLAATQIDGILFVSTTGIATPSFDARLTESLGLRPDVLRLPLFGWGCAGAVAGLARAGDLARANPRGRYLVVALELCTLSHSLGSMRGESVATSMKSMVALSLFSDGCAAAIVAGDLVAGSGPRLVAARSHLFPKTERIMGWDVMDDHMEVVLSPTIPALVKQEMAAIVQPLLDDYLDGMPPTHWVLHPGGAKVVAAYQSALALEDHQLDATRDVLREHGNMSSPTVMFVLERAMRDMQPGETALVGALGPGFAAELLILAA